MVDEKSDLTDTFKNLYEGKWTDGRVKKHGMIIHISIEQFFDMVWRQRYGAFIRLTHTEVVHPHPDDIAEFHKLNAVLEETVRRMAEKGWVDPDILYEEHWDEREPVAHVPESRTVLIQDETDEEFMARIDAAYLVFEETGHWPVDVMPNPAIHWGMVELLSTPEWEDYKIRLAETVEKRRG